MATELKLVKKYDGYIDDISDDTFTGVFTQSPNLNELEIFTFSIDDVLHESQLDSLGVGAICTVCFYCNGKEISLEFTFKELPPIEIDEEQAKSDIQDLRALFDDED